MKKSFLTTLAISSCTAMFLLSGCGDSALSEVSSTSVTGQLVDSYVENADYRCGDGANGVTDKNGTFECKSLPIEFKLGGLKLGKITTLAADAHVFPQELLGLKRSDVNNSSVVAMARLLQSCDEDKNSSNGLKIRQEIKNAFTAENDFNASDLDAYATDANLTLVNDDDAREHLTQTTELVDRLGNSEDIPSAIKTELLTPAVELSKELKDSLIYMDNEERLAYDVYNKLYETYPLSQLTNIANKSEIKHIEAVEVLIEKYLSDAESNSTDDLQAGTYSLKVIQDLYDMLLAKGVQSSQDALEVGCMVEVTDINDLNGDIILAQESNATDITSTFEFLRTGSYSHYWAFDKGLKSMGITDGCCVLGADYCHPEYPSK